MPRTTNAEAAYKFFQLARTGRASLVGLSDSNQLIGGHGWDAGQEIAMKQRFGLWATAPATEVNMDNHGYYWKTKSSVQAGVASTDIVSALAAKFDWGSEPFPPGDNSPGRRYAWVRQDTAGSPTGTTRSDLFGIEMDTATAPYPFDITKELKFHLQIAEFRAATGYNDSAFASHVAGTYRPGLRIPATSGGETSLAALQTCTLSAGGAGSETWLDKAFTVTAGTMTGATTSVQFMPGSRSTFNLKSDLGIGYMSVEAATVAAGMRTATYQQGGGASLYDFGVQLEGANIAALTGFFSLMHEQPNAAVSGKIPVCFRICSGTNDQNETELDFLTGTALSSTEEGYYLNLVGIYNRIITAWVAMGGDLTKLYFWISQTPRLDASYLSYQQAYARAARRFALDYDNPNGVRVFATDFSYITSEPWLTANYYASGGTDKAHGTSAAAFATVLGMEIDALAEDGSPGVRGRSRPRAMSAVR